MRRRCGRWVPAAAAAAAATAAWGAVAVAGAVLISVGGAIAVSPLAPIGPVRLFDPVKGVQADWLVLGGGAAVLLILLAAPLAWLAWRAVRHQGELSPARSSALVTAAAPRRACRSPWWPGSGKH